MDLKDWVHSYCAEQRDEIRDKLQSVFAYKHGIFIIRKDSEIEGVIDFVKHMLKLYDTYDEKLQVASAINNAVNELAELSHYLYEMGDQYEKISDYMFHKKMYNDMAQGINDSNEQKHIIEFFIKNQNREAKEMSKLKDEIQGFDWNKEEEVYAAWLKGYNKWNESNQNQNQQEQSIEPEA